MSEEYTGPERRSYPYDLIKAIREEVRQQIETRDELLVQRLESMEERFKNKLESIHQTQKTLHETQITLRANQDEIKQKISNWEAGARWVNLTAVAIAAIIVAVIKARDWLKVHINEF